MGLFQAYIIPDIKEQDWERVGQAEHMSIEVFPTLNERLYLCYLYGKNIIQNKISLWESPYLMTMKPM